MNDENYVLVEYLHQSRGQHLVVGLSTKQRYGYRKNGDVFLIHKDDFAAARNFYRQVNVVQEPAPAAVPAPPPTPVWKEPEPVAPPEPLSPPPAVAAAVEEQRLDLQLLPGATPNVVSFLTRAGLTSPEKILEAGVEGLIKVKFVGATKAELIYNYVLEKYG